MGVGGNERAIIKRRNNVKRLIELKKTVYINKAI